MKNTVAGSQLHFKAPIAFLRKILLLVLISIGLFGCKSKNSSGNTIKEMILSAKPANAINPGSADWINIYNQGNDAIPVLIEMLSTSKNTYIKIHCAWGLGKLKAEKSLPALLKCLRNKKEDYLVRWTAAWAIQNIAGTDLSVPRPWLISTAIPSFPLAEEWAENAIKNSKAGRSSK
jgi:hypothetical protein